MELKLVYLCVIFLCLMKAVHIRAQCPPPLFPSKHVVSSESWTSFPERSTVTFQCLIGHVPVNSDASATVTCVGSQWTDLELTCTKKSCGGPPDFVEGRYIITGILFGDTITPVCNTGFFLAGYGSQQRVCRDEGWDGRDPYCEVVKCGAPPNIPNGHLEDERLESYDYLYFVTYRCNDVKLSLIGSSTLHCAEDGTFKPDPPICMEGCPMPEIPNAIRIGGNAPPFKMRDSIKYRCEDGFTMRGESFIVCGQNGWRPEPPQCNGPCSTPDFEGNVVLTDNDISRRIFPHGSTVTFQCRAGYEPLDSTASKSVYCNNSTWTKLFLTCKKKSCGSPPDFANGKYITTGILFGDIITPVCNTGYVLAAYGSQQRVCRDQGWDGRDPYCEVVKCGAPPGIENGRLEDERLGSYDYSHVVTYRCNEKLSLIGSSTLHCAEDGTFKPEPPKCMDGCPKPEIPNAIKIDGKAPPYKMGDSIKYRCEDGFTMRGESFIVCGVNGWSPEPPVCTQCSPPSFPSKHVVSSNSWTSFMIGSTVTFQCLFGHVPVNSDASATVTCVGNQWTDLELTCTKKSCGSPPDFANGKYILTGILFGDTITPVCNTGYVLAGNGSQQRVCRDEGWDGRDPYCEVVKCRAPPNIPNGHLEDEPLESYDYSHVVTYKCNDKLSLIGSSTLRCAEDGTFKPEPPKCMDGCPMPEIPNAFRFDGNAPPFKIGDSIKYRCHYGFTMRGERVIVCGKNGWSPEPPQCIGICLTPDFEGNVVLTDNDISQEIFPHGSTVTFQCRAGYEPLDSTASKSVSCNNSMWTKLFLTCKKKSCGSPPDFANGKYITTGILFGDIITPVCNTGYVLAGYGSQQRVCRDQGWDGKDPYCEGK